MRQSPQRLGDGVFAVDAEHVRREADASYLIVDGGRAAFVDTLPRARVVVRARGAPHLTDPARHALLDGDAMLNAAGLDVWLRRAA
jgi:hypothetical protein